MADDYLTIRDKNRAKTRGLMERSGYRPTPMADPSVNDLGFGTMPLKEAARMDPKQILDDRYENANRMALEKNPLRPRRSKK